MTTLRRILAATDFSQLGDHAVGRPAMCWWFDFETTS